MSVADALLVELRAAVPNDVTVYDGAVPGIPTSRYVVLYAGEGLRSASGVDGASRDLSNQFQVTTVASRPEASGSAAPLTRWLQSRVLDRLVDRRLVVDGLVCGPIVHTLSNPPVIDEAVKDRPTVYAVDQFEVQADRL